MTGTYETILWERDDAGVGTLTINRPEQFNGMTTKMLREAHELLHSVADDETLTVIVLTGAGKAFCPGAGSVDRGDRHLRHLVEHHRDVEVLVLAGLAGRSRCVVLEVGAGAERLAGTGQDDHGQRLVCLLYTSDAADE